jgi:hypothetical protein
LYLPREEGLQQHAHRPFELILGPAGDNNGGDVAKGFCVDPQGVK